MVKKMLKSKSKRVSAKKRYKIERKVREHNRRIKKSEKAKNKFNRKKKIITVPGDCPFKEQILKEAIQTRENIRLAKQTRREEVKASREAKKEEILATKRGLSQSAPTPASDKARKLAGNVKLDERKVPVAAPAPTFNDLLKRAQERGYFYEKIEQAKTQRDSSLKAFYKEFQQVIQESDVIIQVLDSRDPLGTRSTEAEETVKSQTDKKLIMVLNKCDLIPVENLQKWIAYLKQTEGCVVLPFKANTQKQKDRFGSIGVVNTTNQASMDTKKSIGAADLLGLLGNWARGAAGGLTVGVIGMPNVGKSSLINSLKRSKACHVGAKPGVTRACQFVQLDSKLKLVDSPGVCFSKEKGSDAMTVETILARVPKTTLMLQYGIPEFNGEDEFLSFIATKFGQLKKGGIPSPEAASQKIIHDWHTGAIRFFTEPPEQVINNSSTAFVAALAEPFSLDNFTNQPADEVMSDDEAGNEEVEMEEASESEEPPRRVTRSSMKKQVSFAVDTEVSDFKGRKKLRPTSTKTLESAAASKEKLHGLLSTKKPVLKKLRKSKKKITKHADNLADIIDNIAL